MTKKIATKLSFPIGLQEGLPILVGEANPYGSVEYALYPDPPGGSGWRLCHRVMGLESQTYLSSFERVNLFQTTPSKWSPTRARTAARDLLKRFGRRVYILFGNKVAAAFGLSGLYKKEGTIDGFFLSLPHPSGLSRYSDDDSSKKSRDALRAFFGVERIPFGEVDLEDREADGVRLEKAWRLEHQAEKLDVNPVMTVHHFLGVPEEDPTVRAPWQDHGRLYRFAGRWLCAVFHPYGLDPFEVDPKTRRTEMFADGPVEHPAQNLIDFCSTYGLHANIHSRSSHFPGRTLCVELMKEDDYWEWVKHIGT